MRSPQSSLLEDEWAQLSQLFLIRDALIEVVHPPSHPQWIFKVPPALSPPRWVQWHHQLPASTRTWQRFCRSAPKAPGFVYPAGKPPKSQAHPATPTQLWDPLQPRPHSTEPQGFSLTSHSQSPVQHFRQKNGKDWKRNVGDKPVRASLAMAELSENSAISSHGSASGAAQSSGTIPDIFPLLFQTTHCKMQ